MTDTTVGELVSVARQQKLWTRERLADATGYSAVMIAKIENDERLPRGDKLPKLAAVLGIDEDVLRSAAAGTGTDRRKVNAPKIAKAVQLARRNADRASALKARANQLKRDADEEAKALDALVRSFDADVIVPFADLVSRVKNIPEDVVVTVDIDAAGRDAEFVGSLREAQVKTSKSIYALVGAGVLGGGAGAALGAGAATATYMTVAAIASASTGAAISSLSGVAASSATLAAIGGGSLAAGGAGIAGGTAVLTGIVAFPVLTLAAAALFASGGRVLEKQESISRQLDEAERELEDGKNARVVRKFIARLSDIQQILTVALVASRSYRRTIERALPVGNETEWADLDGQAQAAIRRLAEIVLACLTVLSMPIGMSLKQGAAPEEGTSDGDAPKVDPVLEVEDDREGEFIDFVIEEALTQVAR